MIKPRQPRLTIREQIFRKKLINYCWENYRASLTMEEMANIFRMQLAQFYKIIKGFKDS